MSSRATARRSATHLPAVGTIKDLAQLGGPFAHLDHRRYRSTVRVRLERLGYVPVVNPHMKRGWWKFGGDYMVLYGDATLSPADRLAAAQDYYDARL